jgi:hypothetical protein
VIPHGSRDADPAGLCQGFQPRRNIHTVAEDVLLLDDHVAKVDADAEPDPLLLGHLPLAVNHPALDFYCAANGIHDTGKFRQEAIAGVLYDPAPMLLDLWIDQLPEMSLEPFVRAFLIDTHQARISRHVGGEDCSEAAGLAHMASPAARSRPER